MFQQISRLGQCVNCKLSAADAATRKLSHNCTLLGNFTNQKITTDINSAVTKLTTQLVNQQKTDWLRNISLDGLYHKKQKPGDTKTASPCSATKEEVKAKATDLLNGLFKRKESCRYD
jgi:hypothetical protein